MSAGVSAPFHSRTSLYVALASLSGANSECPSHMFTSLRPLGMFDVVNEPLCVIFPLDGAVYHVHSVCPFAAPPGCATNTIWYSCPTVYGALVSFNTVFAA